jgi:hypothetical protein
MATKVPATTKNSPPVVVGKNKDNISAAQSTGTEFFPGDTAQPLEKYIQPRVNPNSTDIYFSQDPNKLRSQEISKQTGVQRVSVGDPARGPKTEGITIRGCGAATKGTKSRGPMA